MKKRYRHTALNLTTAALLSAAGILLPMLFHAFGASGSVFLPMHIPVLLAGIVCGPLAGFASGALVPLLSSLITGMPPLLPAGASMILELAAYGAVSGFLSEFFSGVKNRLLRVYLALIPAMLLGRGVGGAASAAFYAAAGMPYSFQIFLSGAFVTALPGIAVQLVLIPAVLFTLQDAGILQKYVTQGPEKTPCK